MTETPPRDEMAQMRRSPRALDVSAVEIEPDPFPEVFEASPVPAPSTKPRFTWLGLLASGLGGLAVLGIGLWADTLIRTLLERQPALGWLAAGLAALVIAGGLGLIIREWRALARLSSLDAVRDQAQAAYDADDRRAARATVQKLTRLYAGNPRTAQGRTTLAQQSEGVLDARDLLPIAEDALLGTLDEEAVEKVSSAARRVSLVTALSPRALIDIAMVVIQCVTLARQIAEIYGARPGFLGAIRLGRHMLTHLAVTGGLAATEGLVSQVLGHSLAARLSARLGEGVINGLLTARVGIAAIAVTRPLPYFSGKPPTLSDVTRGMANLGGKEGKPSGKGADAERDEEDERTTR